MTIELSDNSLKISRPFLAALLSFTSKDQTRPHLCSIQISRSKGRIAATDGHRLIVWEDGIKREGPDVLLLGHKLSPILSWRTASGSGRSKKRKPEPDDLMINLGKEDALIAVGDASLRVRYLDATFPPVEEVIPKYKDADPRGVVAFSPGFFADVTRLAKAISWRSPCAILHVGPGELDPLLVKFNDSKWTVVVMPMRANGTMSAKPAPPKIDAKKVKAAQELAAQLRAAQASLSPEELAACG